MKTHRANAKCKVCRKPSTMTVGLYRVCSMDCALALARTKQAGKAKRTTTISAETKRWRRENETLGELKDRIQGYCNAYVKERDWGKPCFTCNRPHDFTHKRDAGHFKAVGAGGASPARYHPNNIRMTCTQCNTHRGGGNHPNYRPNLVAEIGEDMVQAVERLHNSTVKWNREALEQLGAWFRAEARRLKALREAQANG